ncbi:MAG: GNAT family N-acetyltransferase [Candidatus Cloacimonetes bacterium]|nr:GNAT family N-acetyltransferase [Candidatus Cloacimonadota bacterium]
MIRIVNLIDLSEHQFLDVTAIWKEAGIGNPSRGDTYEAVCQTLKNGGRMVLALDEDRIVGTVWLTHDFRRLYIHHMCVLPEYQNQGIGKILLNESLKVASELKYQAKLEVYENNTIAYNLYKSFGFEPLEKYHTLIKRDV